MSNLSSRQFIAVKIGEAELTSFLESIGYKVLSMEQQWRNITAKISKHNTNYFFKLGSTPEISQRTINEYSFYKYMNGRKSAPILSPKPISTGVYAGNLNWFIAEWIEGEILVKKDDTSGKGVARLKEFFPTIIRYLEFLDQQSSNIELARDRTTLLDVYMDKLIDTSQDFFMQIKQVSTGRNQETIKRVNYLINYLQTNSSCLQLVLTHNDFVPWHLIVTPHNNLYSIDAEHSSFFYNKFHDVVTFYHRIFVFMNNPILGERFLGDIKSGFGIKEGENLETQLKFAMAHRLIGGYWEAIVKEWSDVEAQNKIFSKFFSDFD